MGSAGCFVCALLLIFVVWSRDGIVIGVSQVCVYSLELLR